MKPNLLLPRRILSIFVAFVMMLMMWLQNIPAAAAAIGDEYTIANAYIRYSFNARTGGFSIETKDGHPQKSYDNNIPLLYREDISRSNGTSFTTIRIDGKDYIFGQEYGWFGISTKLHQPVISNEGRLMSISWDIKNYTVTQNVAISLDENNPLCGNVGISYTVTNHSGSDGNVGIRLMLDNALDSNIDAPYVMVNQISPTLVETEYVDDIPQQIRYMDSLSSPDKMAYALLDGWSGQSGIMVDKVVTGHWVNLANTRFDYTPNPNCDFSNYSNEYLIPDTATAFYWNEKPLKAGESRAAEMLYGIGNFAQEMKEQRVAIGINVGKIELDSNKKSYLNGGKFSMTVSIDNSVNNARQLLEPLVMLSVDEGLIFEKTGTREYRAEISGGLNVGTVFDIPDIVLIAENQAQITSRRIVASITATEVVDDSTQRFVEYSANSNILLPAVGGVLPDIVMNQINPATVYYEGEKGITVSGDMKALSEALAASDGWNLHLVSSADRERILIEKKRISFVEEGKTMSFSTTDLLTIGRYDIEFEFQDQRLIASFGRKITASAQLKVSNDPLDRCASYGIVSMVRFEHPSNHRQTYDFVSFNNESELTSFTEGTTVKNGLMYQGIKFENSSELLLTVRGKLRQMIDGSGKSFYQASKADGDITINSILTYSGDEPLKLTADAEGAVLEGDGTLRVINSINVWHNAWEFAGENGTKFSLNREDVADGNAKSFELSLVGAGSMIQYLGGFLINLKFGEMTKSNGMYGISFGGKITLPIKAPDKKGDEGAGGGSGNGGKKPGKDDDDEPDDGSITAAINDVLFGQNGEDIGFLGINTILTVKLPEDVMGSMVKNAFGVEAEVTINTIDNYYRIELGLELTMLECQGSIAFKQVPVKSVPRIVLDELSFYLGGDFMQIPIVPPYVFMTGLGGGISGLADTIGDKPAGELPPITINLKTQLQLIQTLEGDFALEVKLSGIKFDGELRLRGDDEGKIMKMSAGMAIQWVSPFYVSAYGKVSICAGVLSGGFTIKITEDYFYGYIYATLIIPDDVPLVGGMELAKVEAAISSDFIGANIRIIGIEFGIIYYWDGELEFGSGIDLSSRGLAVTYIPSTYEDDNGELIPSTMAYGTNMRRLISLPVAQTRAGGGVIKYFDPSGQDALLFDIPLKGTGKPQPDEIILTNPDGQRIPMVESDGSGGGNYLIQTRDDKNYLYITITNPTQLAAGNWTLSITADNVSIDGFEVNGVDNLPVIASVSFERTSAQSRELKVLWITDTQGKASGDLNVYVTKDSGIISRIQQSDVQEGDSLVNIGNVSLKHITSGEYTFILPDTFEEGDYYVIAMLSDHQGGMSIAMGDDTFTFLNPNLPGKPEAAVLSYAGDGAVELSITANELLPCNYYMVALIDEHGQEIPNSVGKYAINQEIRLSPMQTGSNEPALQTGKTYYAKAVALKEAISDKNEPLYYYSTESAISEGMVMPEINNPTLLSCNNNLPAGGNEIITNNALFEAAYTFDMPVRMWLIVNGVRQGAPDEYKTEWAVGRNLEDGTHIIDFEAINEQNDSVTGIESNEIFGFTVDTAAPVLSIGQSTAVSMGENAEEAAVSNQIVFVNEDGLYIIDGVTEKSANITLDGTTDGVTIHEDGTFKIIRSTNSTEADQILLLKAEDSAGNVTELKIHLVNRSLAAFESIRLISDLESSGQQLDYIEMSVGHRTILEVKGLTPKGEAVLSPEGIVWAVLYEQNIIRLSQDGTIEALAPGEAAVKASYRVAVVEDDNGQKQYIELADVIRVRIRDVGYRYELRQTNGFTLLTLYTSEERGMATITMDGKTTVLFYDATKKAYVGAFNQRLTSEQLTDNIVFEQSKKPPVLLRGDTDGDNTLSKVDIQATVNAILNGGYDWRDNAECWLRADMNGDGVVDIIDAQLTLLELLK